MATECWRSFVKRVQAAVPYRQFDVPATEHSLVCLAQVGCSSYMNCILHQLAMSPAFVQVVQQLNISNLPEDSLITEFVQTIKALAIDQKKSFLPQGLFRTYRHYGQPIDIREPQDATTFYQQLSQQIDTALKELWKKPLFERVFQLSLVDQWICADCSHKEEKFYKDDWQQIEVTTADKSLKQALDTLTRSRDITNYPCSQCSGRGHSAKSRYMFAAPPNVLVIRLMRFQYDYDKQYQVKHNEYFTFPRTLDISSYTAEAPVIQTGRIPGGAVCQTKQTTMTYDLVGIVMHQGSGSIGIYYSYIMDRRPDSETKGQWFKFYNNLVERVNLTDDMMAKECFGGEFLFTENGRYRRKERDVSAYMLFYEQSEAKPLARRQQRRRSPRDLLYSLALCIRRQ